MTPIDAAHPQLKIRHLFRFESEAALRGAVGLLRQRAEELDTLIRFETYSPYPLNLPDCVGHATSSTLGSERSTEEAAVRPSPLAIAAFTGGLIGGLSGYGMQYYIEVLGYPRMVADRPAHSWPAFVPVTFEMTILFAAVAVFFTFFWRTGLPEPHHVLFETAGFERATQDRFFLELWIPTEEASLLARKLNSSEVIHVGI